MKSAPNFFIVGAPKSGTTALYEYLRGHPNIYMPAQKEPSYFARDFPNYPSYRDYNDYIALFKSCTVNHIAIGEASVLYLYSNVALSLIYEFNSKAKIIAMLRNPVDLAYSMHQQALYNFNEDVPDFEQAWKLQAARAQGLPIPKGCRAAQLLQYKSLASLGEQVQRLLNIFPPEQVKLIFFDDFISNTKQVYKEVLVFLQVPLDSRSVFPLLNEAKTHKYQWLGKWTQTPPEVILWLVRFARRFLGINIAQPLALLRRLNEQPMKRPPLKKKFVKHLQDEFREDIKLLEVLTERDLSHWLE